MQNRPTRRSIFAATSALVAGGAVPTVALALGVASKPPVKLPRPDEHLIRRKDIIDLIDALEGHLNELKRVNP